MPVALGAQPSLGWILDVGYALFSLGKQLLQGDCLRKLELHLGARANDQHQNKVIEK